MQALIFLIGLLAIGAIVLFIIKYIHHYFYPEYTVSSQINNPQIGAGVQSGDSGANGANGILQPLAVDGLPGSHGIKGTDGSNGRNVFAVGSAGSQGPTGLTGIPGVIGAIGSQGVPSNDIIPQISKYYNTDDYRDVSLLDHEFVYDGEVRHLGGTFVFDNIDYFSFHNDANNKPLMIYTNDGLTLEDGFSKTTYGGLDYYHKVIYSTVRVIVESNIEKSDGKVLYVSPPIHRRGILIKSPVNYNSLMVGTNKVEEVIIGSTRDFGLNFRTVINDTGSPVYNYILGGIMRYKCLFNITPKSNTLNIRLEEKLSVNPIEDLSVWKLKLPSKGNILGVRPEGNDNIYLLSNRLKSGTVISKDSANESQIWINLPDEALDSSNASAFRALNAFQEIDNQNKNFNSKSLRGFNYTVDKYTRAAIVANIAYRLTKDIPGDDNAYFTTTTAAPHDYPTAGVPTNIPLVTNYELFSTKMVLNNLSISYLNNDKTLAYPSGLEGSSLYLKFYLKVQVNDPTIDYYNVWMESNTVYPIVIKEHNKALTHATVRNYEWGVGEFPLEYVEGYLYYPIQLDIQDKIEFSKFFGKRAIIELSKSTADVGVRFGLPDNYNTADLETRLLNQVQTDDAFEVSVNPDYSYGNIWGWDYYFKTDKISVADAVVTIGYQNSTGKYIHRVKAYKESNGDYYFDIPTYGFRLN